MTLKTETKGHRIGHLHIGNYYIFWIYWESKKSRKHIIYRTLVEIGFISAENEGFEPPEV